MLSNLNYKITVSLKQPNAFHVIGIWKLFKSGKTRLNFHRSEMDLERKSYSIIKLNHKRLEIRVDFRTKWIMSGYPK